MEGLDQKLKVYARQQFFNALLAVSLLLIVGFGLFGYYTGEPVYYLLGLLLPVFAALLVVLRLAQLIFKRLYARSHDYEQLEALFSVYQYLKPQALLPKMRNYAGSPDFLREVLLQLQQCKPKVIVEASSGLSSMVVSEWLLQHAPEAVHYALEDEAKYAGLTRQQIFNPNSHILHAPITEHKIDGKPWKWYDISEIAHLEQIDLLIIDGPPLHLQDQARYPAVPLLADRLSDQAVILLDDGNRPDERAIARRWAKELGMTLQYLPLEKGAYLLSKA